MKNAKWLLLAIGFLLNTSKTFAQDVVPSVNFEMLKNCFQGTNSAINEDKKALLRYQPNTHFVSQLQIGNGVGRSVGVDAVVMTEVVGKNMQMHVLQENKPGILRRAVGPVAGSPRKFVGTTYQYRDSNLRGKSCEVTGGRQSRVPIQTHCDTGIACPSIRMELGWGTTGGKFNICQITSTTRERDNKTDIGQVVTELNDNDAIAKVTAAIEQRLMFLTDHRELWFVGIGMKTRENIVEATAPGGWCERAIQPAPAGLLERTHTLHCMAKPGACAVDPMNKLPVETEA